MNFDPDDGYYHRQNSVVGIGACPISSGTQPTATWTLTAQGALQNAAGRCLRVGATNDLQLWTKPLPELLGFTHAALVINRQAASLNLSLPLADVPGLVCGGSCLVRDVWARRDFLQSDTAPLPVALRAHQSAVFAFAPAGRAVEPGSAEARALLAAVAGRSMFDELPAQRGGA